MPRPPKGMFQRAKSKTGKPRTWYVRLFRDGKEKWVSLGSNFSEACREFRKLKNSGELPSRLTVGKAAERWLDLYIATARNSKNQVLARRRVEMYLKPGLGHMLLSRIKADHLREYRLRWVKPILS